MNSRERVGRSKRSRTRLFIQTIIITAVQAKIFYASGFPGDCRRPLHGNNTRTIAMPGDTRRRDGGAQRERARIRHPYIDHFTFITESLSVHNTRRTTRITLNVHPGDLCFALCERVENTAEYKNGK